MYEHNCCCNKIRLRLGIRIVGWIITLFVLSMMGIAVYFWFLQKNLAMLIICSSYALIYVPAIVAFFCMICTSRFDSIFSRKFFRATIMFALVIQLLVGVLAEGVCLTLTYAMNKTNEYYRIGFYIFAIYSVGIVFLLLFSLIVNCIFLKIAKKYIILGQ